jgi:hypothetical protein
MPINEGALRELDEFDSLMRKKFDKYRKMIFLLRDIIESFDVNDARSIKGIDTYLKLINLAEQEIEDQEQDHREWLRKRVASKRGILEGLKTRLLKAREELGVETDEDLINELLNMAEERIMNLSKNDEI